LLIDHEGIAKKLWDVGIIIILLYTATYAPFKTAFLNDEDSSKAILVFETLVDTMFVMDIFLTFLTPFKRFNGSVESRHKYIAANYVTGAFAIDMIASFPTQVFQKSSNPGTQKLLRLARLQRLYRLMRILRVIKLLKISKYSEYIQEKMSSFKFSPSSTRLIGLCAFSFFAVHLFSCFFYLSAKMNDFDTDTWVYQKGITDSDVIDSYSITLYWAFQTLTTVGYGDFGAYNNYEIAITCVWMFIGVAFYSVVVGSLTSMLVDDEVQQESLNTKLKALEEFSVNAGLEPTLRNDIKSFLQNNYYDLFLKVEIESLTNELPPNIKEEIFFHQYGFLVNDIAFF